MPHQRMQGNKIGEQKLSLEEYLEKNERYLLCKSIDIYEILDECYATLSCSPEYEEKAWKLYKPFSENPECFDDFEVQDVVKEMFVILDTVSWIHRFGMKMIDGEPTFGLFPMEEM